MYIQTKTIAAIKYREGTKISVLQIKKIQDEEKNLSLRLAE